MKNLSSLYKHYFIIGAQRSGTTYLSKILDQHPEILMAKPIFPEPKYFIDKNIKTHNYLDYLNLFFTKRKDGNILVEKTVAYFENFNTFKQIKKIIKDFKVIIILRNPVDRAISHYNFSKSTGLEKLNFNKVLNSEKERSIKWKKLIKRQVYSDPFAYIERGKYYKYILKWEKLIGRKNIILIISENFFENLEMIKNIYKRLGVNENFIPSTYKIKINETNKNKISPAIYKILKKKFTKSNNLLKERYNLDISRW